MMQTLHRTPLFDWHVSHNGRMVEFGGWEMPVQYTTVMDEHVATRTAVGLTDVSHMGRLRFEGDGACAFLDSFLTRNVAVIKPGQVRYSLICNEQGGIVDDVLIGLNHPPDGSPYYTLVVNASNREKVLAKLHKHLTPDVQKQVSMTDLTTNLAMFAIQGPKAAELLQPFVDADLATIKYYNGLHVALKHPKAADRTFLLTRTGYTGEDGFEICIDSDIAAELWDAFLDAGQPFGAKPTGLGARDTLRLEAALPLYGHEMSDDITPFEAGLGYAVFLDGPKFPGYDALKSLLGKPLSRVRVGLELDGKRPAREGCDLYNHGEHNHGEKIGVITSGSFAPTLEKPIAMGYVPPSLAEPGTTLDVDIRGKHSPAKIVPLPFYQRKK